MKYILKNIWSDWWWLIIPLFCGLSAGLISYFYLTNRVVEIKKEENTLMNVNCPTGYIRTIISNRSPKSMCEPGYE